MEQLFDASRHRQTLAGTLGFRGLCGAEERRIKQNAFSLHAHDARLGNSGETVFSVVNRQHRK